MTSVRRRLHRIGRTSVDAAMMAGLTMAQWDTVIDSDGWVADAGVRRAVAAGLSIHPDLLGLVGLDSAPILRPALWPPLEETDRVWVETLNVRYTGAGAPTPRQAAWWLFAAEQLRADGNAGLRLLAARHDGDLQDWEDTLERLVGEVAGGYRPWVDNDIEAVVLAACSAAADQMSGNAELYNLPWMDDGHWLDSVDGATYATVAEAFGVWGGLGEPVDRITGQTATVDTTTAAGDAGGVKVVLADLGRSVAAATYAAATAGVSAGDVVTIRVGLEALLGLLRAADNPELGLRGPAAQDGLHVSASEWETDVSGLLANMIAVADDGYLPRPTCPAERYLIGLAARSATMLAPTMPDWLAGQVGRVDGRIAALGDDVGCGDQWWALEGWADPDRDRMAPL